MPRKRKETEGVREMRRQLWRGRSNCAAARDLGINRKTVATYRNKAQEQGPLEGPLPELCNLHRLLEETMQSPPPPQNV
jgi:FixJ family two-component response regulator